MVAPDTAPVITLGCEDYIFGNGRGGKAEREKNIAYILHACNSYPRLVAELQRLDDVVSSADQEIIQSLLYELGE